MKPMTRLGSVLIAGVVVVGAFSALFAQEDAAPMDANDAKHKNDNIRLVLPQNMLPSDRITAHHAIDMITQGRDTFRDDTFGSEAFFGDTLQLHKAIVDAAHGGLGTGVTPKTALSLGLKVDSTALPEKIIRGIKRGTVNLDDPATTVALLQKDAVVGVKMNFDRNGLALNMGITCAFCHSTVDDFIAPGVGRRLDGWANRDLNVGAILAISPNLQPVADLLKTDVATVKTVLTAWGPGRFDAELFLDGKGFRPDGKTAATLIPDAFGLAGVNLHTYTGWGSVTYWNAFVANLEMHGKGTFYDPRLDDATKFPIAAANKFSHLKTPPDQDLTTSKLAALHFYQLSIPAPAPPKGSFDATASARGQALFVGKASCVNCHVPPLYTEPGWNMHTGEELGIDNFQANRSPDNRYRTTPLKGVWHRVKGGFYHDGRFATLADVVAHYNAQFNLNLTTSEQSDLVEYLKSLGDEVSTK